MYLPNTPLIPHPNTYTHTLLNTLGGPREEGGRGGEGRGREVGEGLEWEEEGGMGIKRGERRGKGEKRVEKGNSKREGRG